MLHISPGFTLYCAFLAALIGLCAGSFLCCAGQRAAHKASVLKGRSHCDSCGHVLSARDLIPLVSFVLAGGRCRYCGKRLSPLMPAAELLTAGVFLLLLFRFDISLRLWEGLLLSSILLACTFADLEGYIIPDRFILLGVLVRLLFIFLSRDLPAQLLAAVLGGFCVAAAVLLAALAMEKLLKREAMGGGDIKLLFLTGLYLGWQKNLLCLLLACLFGLIFGAVALHLKRRGSGPVPPADGEAEEEMADEKLFPWGPSIALAAIAAYTYGDSIISWYLGLFGM